MSETPTTHEMDRDDFEAFIPPHYMLYVAGLGLLIALFVLLTQPQFNVVGWGGLALAGLAVIGWALMAPEQVKAALTGRTAQYGGTAIVVTGIFFVALIGIYSVVKSQNLRFDATQRDTFSLTQASREAIEELATDPEAPTIKLLAFYSINQANRRDSNAVLFDDYESTSEGKITYEFIDPDRNPLQAETYGVTRSGQIAVAPLDEAGEPITDNAELVNSFSQEQITNAIMRVAASGDFRAYFLAVQEGLQIDNTGDFGLSQLESDLSGPLRWTVQQVSVLDLAGSVTLGDPEADGEVVVIPGGSRPLPEEQLQVITDFLDQGGNVVLFAGFNPEGGPSLATAPALSDYLEANFGLRVNNDVVVDPVQAFQSPLAPVANDFPSTHNIVSPFGDNAALIFELTHSITVAEETPENVEATELARSSPNAFSNPVPDQLTDEALSQLAQSEGETTGRHVLAAAAENTETGARVVVFGTDRFPANRYEQFLAAEVQNFFMTLRSISWATGFDNFVTNMTQIDFQGRPQDAPVVVTSEEMSLINFVTVLALPFGILGAGLLVWWRGREREAAARGTEARGER